MWKFSNIKALVAKTIIVLTGNVLVRGSRLPGRDNFGKLSRKLINGRLLMTPQGKYFQI